MSQATRPNDRHIIWSNRSLDVDDWREDYKEFLEANELDDDPNDEQALYEWMEETNYDYLSDERVNLNVQLSQPIIVIGDIGRWNGRVMGYKDIPSGNIRDCLYADTDYTEWYVDKISTAIFVPMPPTTTAQITISTECLRKAFPRHRWKT
ncbi:hypothetical protein [Yeguia hominis]|uniref:hypothetical protein n=1 Tax=Yeguia hominis TaxID=2763662 RepID=UPI00201656C7|nr:hypothetical protein [Yeguia hominis]